MADDPPPAAPAIPDMSTPEIVKLSEDFLPGVYSQLRKMAASRMALGGPGQTLQPTALVHEAWMRLSSGTERSWRGTSHFCAAAAETMRHILIDRARQRSRAKRWGDQERVPMTEAESEAATADEKALLLDETLEKLGKHHPERARIVLLKFFGGLSNREIATEMEISERTVERQWSFARAWLYREIRMKL